MVHQVRTLCVVTAFVFGLTGCGGDTTKSGDGADVVESNGTTSGGVESTTTGLPEGRTWRGHPLDDPNSLLSKRTIYFDYNSSSVSGEERAAVEAHAQYLADNPNASVILEGHADERGTREYNIGLGDQRANAVRQIKTLFGVSGDQMRTVSYGEEKPSRLGHDESSWFFNRRVEVIYESRE